MTIGAVGLLFLSPRASTAISSALMHCRRSKSRCGLHSECWRHLIPTKSAAGTTTLLPSSLPHRRTGVVTPIFGCSLKKEPDFPRESFHPRNSPLNGFQNIDCQDFSPPIPKTKVSSSGLSVKATGSQRKKGVQLRNRSETLPQPIWNIPILKRDASAGANSVSRGS